VSCIRFVFAAVIDGQAILYLLPSCVALQNASVGAFRIELPAL
jgi:hypothetical protein